MANLITLSRLLLLILVIVIAYRGSAIAQLVNVLILILVFVTDGLDGYVARKRNETSLFGATFDIASDRIVELTMWIVLTDLSYMTLPDKLVPIWVAIVFVIRGTLVDTIRANAVKAEGQHPFDLIRSGIGQWIVGGKFMRIFYAVLKAHAFCWMLLIRPLPVLTPAFWADWAWLLTGIGAVFVYLSVVICIVRGLPVIVEFVYEKRDSLLPGYGNNGNDDVVD
jgi:CDP-diacylglycerol--glycerol-3-phosphate 3-phosphatidyltransferase